MQNFKMHVFWQDVKLMWAMWQIQISIPTAMSNSTRPFLCQLDEGSWTEMGTVDKCYNNAEPAI